MSGIIDRVLARLGLAYSIVLSWFFTALVVMPIIVFSSAPPAPVPSPNNGGRNEFEAIRVCSGPHQFSVVKQTLISGFVFYQLGELAFVRAAREAKIPTDVIDCLIERMARGSA